MLLLFDIDGTLISAGGVGRRALERAMDDLLGIQGALEGVRLHGSTDPVIVQEACAHHLNGQPEASKVEAIFARYAANLEAEIRDNLDRYRVLPGAEAIARAASEDPRMVVGLATGNLEATARIKLKPGKLNRYFGFGGFGSDAGDRALLVQAGIERGQAIAQSRLGRRFSTEEIFVFGDTERDVHAARAAGAQAVGILSGSSYRDVLKAAEPEFCFDSFEAPELWRLLGL